ncbi:hypothetical protein TAMA11512_12990 [Selenomonas sp. TAMA-11512]|uniref:hypothetical protein n=1 Tax=Selenomonas sp. TAMA-11512 TaxID=3095337 RepID=UPI003092A930|nr:hypothetical protein TAMA11512_12990 [Selenomonas sp. TAMA-11512]
MNEAMEQEIKESRKTAEHFLLHPKLTSGIQLTADKNEQMWMLAVQIAVETLNPMRRIFLDIRRKVEKEKQNGFGVGRHGWVARTQIRFADELEKEHIFYNAVPGERTMKTWWRELVGRVVEIHLRLQLKEKIKTGGTI